jgi:hypothetical protein
VAAITAPMPSPASNTSALRPSGFARHQAISAPPRPTPSQAASARLEPAPACASSDGRSCPAGSVAATLSKAATRTTATMPRKLA